MFETNIMQTASCFVFKFKKKITYVIFLFFYQNSSKGHQQWWPSYHHPVNLAPGGNRTTGTNGVMISFTLMRLQYLLEECASNATEPTETLI